MFVSRARLGAPCPLLSVLRGDSRRGRRRAPRTAPAMAGAGAREAPARQRPRDGLLPKRATGAEALVARLGEGAPFQEDQTRAQATRGAGRGGWRRCCRSREGQRNNSRFRAQILRKGRRIGLPRRVRSPLCLASGGLVAYLLGERFPGLRSGGLRQHAQAHRGKGVFAPEACA